MTITEITNKELISYLSAAGIIAVFPLYVCQQKPNAKSFSASVDNGIQGCLVTGKYCGMEWVHSYWLAAHTKAAARLLLEKLRESEGDGAAVTFPLEYCDEAAQVFPDKEVTVDNLYILNPSRFKERQSEHSVSLVTEELLSRIIISDEMRDYIGINHKSYNGIPYFGIIIDNRIVSIGEALCDTGDFAAIQQVYTANAHRGKGLAGITVSHIAKSLIDRTRTPLYWVSEDNVSSVRLAQSLGFELAMRLGCIDI